jgi:multiple sugar transport system permease protein
VRSVAAVGVALLFLLPLVLLVTGSLRSTTLAPPRGPELLPRPLAFENYGRAFELVDLGRYALNSLVVAAIAVPLTLLVASWAGFALSQVPARIQRAVVAASFAALMVPLTALMVPRFAIFRALGLVDTWAPLIRLPSSARRRSTSSCTGGRSAGCRARRWTRRASTAPARSRCGGASRCRSSAP